MNKISLRVYLWAPVLFAVGLPQFAIAQDDDSPFEEITITATKREQSIYDVPIAVSAFQGEILAAQGITTINDIGKFVPNMNVTAFSAGHVSSINVFIRGIGVQDHLIAIDPGVSVSVDGVYLGRQVGQNWSLSNIERVEVLRGPQGTLFGRNSIGGAVNIITKTPGVDPGAKVSLEVGSRGRLNGDFYADWNLSDSSAMSFTGGYKHRDGVGDFINLPNAGIEVGEMQEVYGRATYRYAPSDEFSLTISADANEGKGGLRPYTTLIDEAPFGPFSLAGMGFTNDDLPNDPYDNATLQASQTRVSNNASGISITADWAFSDDFSGKVIASTRSSEYKSGLDDDSLPDDVFSYPEVGEADQTSVELQVNGDFGSWDFVSGLFFFEEDGHNFQEGYVFAGFPPGDFLHEGEITSQAIFANFGFNVSDTLRVAAGLRYTEDDKDAATECCINPRDTGKASFDDVSWDLSANWTLNNGLNLYGAIQSGYQSGQFPPRPFCLLVDPDCYVANDNVTAINYEIGIKGAPADWLQMSAAVFITEYSDLPYQISSTSGGGFATDSVIVDQTSTGLEWESTMLFGENFSLHATVGWIDVDVERDSETGAKGVAPLTPELTYSLSPQFDIPVQNGARVTLRADYSYRDEMWGEPTDDPARFTRIEDRSIVNANIMYTAPDESWTASIYGRNITDERYTNALIYVDDYILRILSNDASEFGVAFTKSF